MESQKVHGLDAAREAFGKPTRLPFPAGDADKADLKHSFSTMTRAQLKWSVLFTLEQQPERSSRKDGLPGHVMKTLGIRTSRKPRLRFSKKILGELKDLMVKEMVDGYHTGKFQRVRLAPDYAERFAQYLRHQARPGHRTVNDSQEVDRTEELSTTGMLDLPLFSELEEPSSTQEETVPRGTASRSPMGLSEGPVSEMDEDSIAVIKDLLEGNHEEPPELLPGESLDSPHLAESTTQYSMIRDLADALKEEDGLSVQKGVGELRVQLSQSRFPMEIKVTGCSHPIGIRFEAEATLVPHAALDVLRFVHTIHPPVFISIAKADAEEIFVICSIVPISRLVESVHAFFEFLSNLRQINEILRSPPC